MEQDAESGLDGALPSYRHICSGCLSTDRNLVVINGLNQVHEVFRLLMYDFAGDRFADPLSEFEQLACWECVAAMRRVARFKRQMHNAQQHLQVLSLGAETLDHTYIAQSLSPLQAVIKTDYDGIYFDYSDSDGHWGAPVALGATVVLRGGGVKDEQFDMAQVVRNNIDLDMDMDAAQILEVGELEDVESSSVVDMAHIVLRAPDGLSSGQLPLLTVSPLDHIKMETVITTQDEGGDVKCGYVTEHMSEDEMRACRETMKEKVQYASAAYKCELCIIGFYSQQQVEDHFVHAHRAKPELVPCKICYVYVERKKLESHTQSHYTRYTCKLCGHVEYSSRLQTQHVRTHVAKDKPDKGALNVAEHTRKRSKKGGKQASSPPKPGDLRKLLSKTTIEGYKCLECDMFFKNSRARKNHVDRFHREGLQCDHCKKRFVNKTTLATHLRLHEGPLPREECPVCHKLVRSIQIKYHIQRHENKTTHTCRDCDKVFSHLATYQAHLKYSRAHASDEVFKFPCPMCNKGYPTKEQMQDHFNYQHLGKTSHKCPVCDKPIASRANVEKHMMRVHGEKKPRPKCHVCQHCGKGFTDKKALTQHAVIHSGERPLSCDVCHQSFKQKASLYTHRKRVHKIFPSKKVVEFMDKS